MSESWYGGKSRKEVLTKLKFENGDEVQYAYGLVFRFIGLNPFNKEEAYCVRDNGKISCLPINRLKLYKTE